MVEGAAILRLLLTLLQRSSVLSALHVDDQINPPVSLNSDHESKSLSGAITKIKLPSSTMASSGTPASKTKALIEVVSSTEFDEETSMDASVTSSTTRALPPRRVVDNANTTPAATQHENTALELALQILSALLMFGETERSSTEEALLQECIAPLQNLAKVQLQLTSGEEREDETSSLSLTSTRRSSLELAQQTADLALIIFQRQLQRDSAPSSSSGKGNSTSAQLQPSESIDRDIQRLAQQQRELEESGVDSEPLAEDVWKQRQSFVTQLVQRIQREHLQHQDSPALRAYGLRQLSLVVAALQPVRSETMFLFVCTSPCSLNLVCFRTNFSSGCLASYHTPLLL